MCCKGVVRVKSMAQEQRQRTAELAVKGGHQALEGGGRELSISKMGTCAMRRAQGEGGGSL